MTTATVVVTCPGWSCDETAPVDEDDPRWSSELREHLDLAHGLEPAEARRLVAEAIRALDEPPC